DKLTQKGDELKAMEKVMEVLRVENEKLISKKDNSLQEVSGELKRNSKGTFGIEFALNNEEFIRECEFPISFNLVNRKIKL
ncbi:11885_t:CDS:1, partial [Ambispora leptoticha]